MDFTGDQNYTSKDDDFPSNCNTTSEAKPTIFTQSWNLENLMLSMLQIKLFYKSFILVFGLADNIATIFIMRRTRAPTTTRIILILLAISDSASLIENMIYTYKIDLPLFGKPFFDLSDGMYGMYVWAHIFFGSISGWLVVILTIERCFAVLMPLTVKRIVSKGRLKVFSPVVL